MSVNALLVQWNGGWRWVASVPSGRRRRERQFDVAAATKEQAVSVAESALDTFADVRQQTTVVLDPKTDDERAYVGYNVGDTVQVIGPDGELNAERVTSITGRWDVNSPGGHPEFTPQLRDIILVAADAFAQQVERMNRGALRGATPAVGPPADPVNIGDVVPEPFHQVWSVPVLDDEGGGCG